MYETAGHFEPVGEIIGSYEVGEVHAKLFMALIVEALAGRLLNGAGYSGDLTVKQGMVRLSESVWKRT